jgi:hypothetical protein
MHEMFPGNCSDTARLLHGEYPDDSPDVAWTSAEIAKSPASRCANHGADIRRYWMGRFPATTRTLLGSCPAIARMIHWTLRRTPCRILRGNCADTDWLRSRLRTGHGLDAAADIVPDIRRHRLGRCPAVARTLAGCCPAVARIIQRVLRG